MTNNHPNRSSSYKGCEITKSSTCLASTGQRLYAVSGRFKKLAGVRPLLPSRAAAREWINSELTAAEMAE